MLMAGGGELDRIMTYLPLGVNVCVDVLGHSAVLGRRRGGKLGMRWKGDGQWFV